MESNTDALLAPAASCIHKTLGYTQYTWEKKNTNLMNTNEYYTVTLIDTGLLSEFKWAPHASRTVPAGSECSTPDSWIMQVSYHR